MARREPRPEASRPDDVRPCPAHSANSCEVSVASPDWISVNAESWQVVADCGTSGPHGDTREEAVEAWNAIPRCEGKLTKDEFPSMQLLAMAIKQSGADGILLQTRTIRRFPTRGVSVVAEEVKEGILLRLVRDAEEGSDGQ